MIERREFDGARDLEGMQDLAAQRAEVLGVGMSLHPGDVAHRIWNGNRLSDPADVVAQWLSHGELAGYGLLWPKDHAFDLVVRPDADDELLGEVLDATVDVARGDERVEIDVSGDDEALIGLLVERGFTQTEVPYVLTAQPIPDGIDVDPGEYELRTVTFDDAARLAEVHGSAFGSTWTEEMYLRHMHDNLGYSPDWELVAVAPDGTFGGFTEMWLDHRNGIGYFEPVGVHADHRRRGIGRLLIEDGMRRMRDAGMVTATVLHERDDERSAGFYASCGFEQVATVSRWEKHFGSSGA